MFVAVAFGAAAPSLAAASEAPVETPESPDAIAAQLDRYHQALWDKRFQDALSIAEGIPLDSLNTTGKGVVAGLRAAAMVGLGRHAEAEKFIAQYEELAPQEPFPLTYVFGAGLLSDHLDFSADAIDLMIARFPDVVRQLDWDTVRYFLRNEPDGQAQRNEDRRIALARLGYGGDTERGFYLAENAVDLLVDRGDFVDAAELLPYVKEPVEIENMLIQKRFSPLWPQIAKLAGPHLATIRAAYVSAVEQQYTADPKNGQLLADYIKALHRSGRLKDAIALRSKLPGTSAEMSKADEPTGWAVNNLALSLFDAGRADEADELFSLLNDAPMPKEYWRVSMKINRLELLVTSGRFQKAVPLIEPTAQTHGSPFAAQLVRRLRFCTLSSLGRQADAAKYLPDLLAHASDAPGPTIDGLLCGGEVDKAEEVALTALKNPDAAKRRSFEQDFVRQLQPHLLTSDDPSVWQGRWGELRARPAIAEAYNRLGRDMPDEYLPPSEQ
jgi:Flp pilus assembly protein TadD